VLAPVLTVEQVRELGLPSTPLKETELRAAGWRERYGVEQTEIDALATLRPDIFREIVSGAIEPYFDSSLEWRTDEARRQWRRIAQDAFDQQVDDELLERLRDEAETHLDALRENLRQVETEVDAADFDLPAITLPEPALSKPANAPLVNSEMELQEAIKVLRQRKNYDQCA